jgi:hypothetical protein
MGPALRAAPPVTHSGALEHVKPSPNTRPTTAVGQTPRTPAPGRYSAARQKVVAPSARTNAVDSDVHAVRVTVVVRAPGKLAATEREVLPLVIDPGGTGKWGLVDWLAPRAPEDQAPMYASVSRGEAPRLLMHPPPTGTRPAPS